MPEFCFWDTKSLGDAIIFIVQIAIEAIIGVITALRLRKSIIGKYSTRITLIHLLVLCWGMLMCGLHSYSVSIFFLHIYQQPEVSVDSFSRNFVRLDFLPGFIVQTIYITICRFYYLGLMNAIEISHLARWEQNYIHYLNFYYILRIVAQGTGIILINIYAQGNEIGKVAKINAWILIIDAVIMQAFLLFSLKIFVKAVGFIPAMKSREKRTLKTEYYLMIFSSFLRVIIDLVFLGLPWITSSASEACLGDFSTHAFHSIFYNVLGNIINHYLPIICILKVYDFDRRESFSEPSQIH